MGKAFSRFLIRLFTHETLVIPDNGAFDYRVLEDMVQTINENEVAPEERLSDYVYHYDVKDRYLKGQINLKSVRKKGSPAR